MKTKTLYDIFDGAAEACKICYDETFHEYATAEYFKVYGEI